MPEYSSTTITPADGVKTPAMNGSTSGNYTLSALRDFILASKGQANGLASLDANGKLPSSQLPDLADDVIVVASYASLPATGTAGKLYITADNNKMYRWDPDLTTPDYVELSVDLSAYATIADLQDGTLEPLISTKAKQDQNGNVIDTTYAKKADLLDGTIVVKEAEIATKDEDGNNIKATYETKADASDLKAAISFNRKRIENLEQKSGSVVDVDYPDYSVYGEVPTGKAKNAIASKLRGVTVAYNQLLENGDFSVDSGWFATRGSLSINTTDHECTYTVTEIGDWTLTNRIDKSNAPLFTVGHKLLVSASFYSTHATDVNFGCNTSNSYKIGRSVASSWSPLANIIAVPSGYTNDRILFGFNATDDGYSLNDIAKFKDLKIHDITQALGSQVADYLYSIEQATTGAGVALFRALVSAQDNSYEAGRLVSTVYSAVKSGYKYNSAYKWRNGYYNSAGQYDSNINAICTVEGGFPITEGQTIVATSDTTCEIDFNIYDANRTQLTYKQTANVLTLNMTAVANSSFVNISFRGSGITASNIKITIGGNDSVVIDTLSLPSSVTLRGILKVVNGNLVVDGDEYDPATGEIGRRYGIVNLGTLSWNYYGYFEAVLPVEPAMNGGTLCIRYDSTSATTVDAMPDKSIRVAGTKVYIKDSSYTSVGSASDPTTFLGSLQGVMLVYEIATPTSDPNPVTPIIDPTIATEGGGTLSTTQTNDPAIVSAMEMTYLTL